MAEEQNGRDMAQETNRSQAPLLCTTGCGFYGNPRKNGMCSKCYKDFLQRQNSSGHVSPPGSSSTESSVGECVLAARSDTSTVTLPAAISTDTESAHNSGTSTASATSAEGNTSGAQSSAAADGLQSSFSAVRAAAIDSEQQAQCSAGSSGTVPSSSMRCSHIRKKRKLEDTDKRIDEEKASVCEASAETEEKPKAKKKNRCFTCHKKVGLTGFDCRCGNMFCSIHRYSDVHSCTFDYRADAAERIRKENPVIVGEKIHKI